MASTQLSPGVVVFERDLTAVANATVDNVAAIVGSFEKGPVESSHHSYERARSLLLSSADPTSITTSIGLAQHNSCCMAAP